jgi:hypothetical protein
MAKMVLRVTLDKKAHREFKVYLERRALKAFRV